MADTSEYFDWLAVGGRILLERNTAVANSFFNFLGGAIMVGETMADCIERELKEEIGAAIESCEYLFVVENFFHNDQDSLRHSLEHYFEVSIDPDEVESLEAGLEHSWVSIDSLPEMDVRPAVVRDRLAEGSYRDSTHMIVWD